MCGPTGIGKSLLVRALTSDLGAAYLHVSPDLITRIAHHEASGAEVVLRSVARVGVYVDVWCVHVCLVTCTCICAHQELSSKLFAAYFLYERCTVLTGLFCW